MMQLIYAISFRCFLRIEETLRIEARHIRVEDEKNKVFELTLDYRKTAQTGGKHAIIFRVLLLIFSELQGLSRFTFTRTAKSLGLMFQPYCRNG